MEAAPTMMLGERVASFILCPEGSLQRGLAGVRAAWSLQRLLSNHIALWDDQPGAR